MQYSVAVQNKGTLTVSADNPKDAIYIAWGLKERKGLNIIAAKSDCANCVVSLLNGKRKTQSFYNVSEQIMFATIAEFECDAEWHIYDHKAFNNPNDWVKWFKNRCKEYDYVIEDTVTVLLVKLSASQLSVLQNLEKSENYEVMGRIVQSLQCVDTYYKY